MTEYNNLSENELQAIISNAENALKQKQEAKYKEVMSRIKELADSIGVTVIINEEGKSILRKRKKVAARYCNPDDASQKWSGRGVAPKWMQALLNAGHDKSEFLI